MKNRGFAIPGASAWSSGLLSAVGLASALLALADVTPFDFLGDATEDVVVQAVAPIRARRPSFWIRAQEFERGPYCAPPGPGGRAVPAAPNRL